MTTVAPASAPAAAPAPERAPAPTPAERKPPVGPSRLSSFLDQVPHIVAVYLAFVAVFCALTAIFPFLREPFAWLRWLIESFTISAAPNLADATLLAILAAAVGRRMRVAWWILMLLWVIPDWLVSFFSFDIWAGSKSEVHVEVAAPSSWTNFVFLGIVIVVLLLARDRFTARMQKGNGWKALGIYVVLVAVATLIGFALLMAFPHTLSTVTDRLAWALDNVLGGLTTTSEPDVLGRGPHWVTFVCGLMGAIAIVVAAFVLFRPSPGRRSLDATDEQRVRTLLARYGDQDSLGYFATRRDKAALFADNGKSAITYRVIAGVSLAGGDPLGEVEAWPDAIEGWMSTARYFGWTPAVMGASETGAKAFAAAGLKAFDLGDEAVLEVRDFSLEGRSMRVVRQAVSRIERAGYTVRVRRHRQLSEEEMAEVTACADAWRDTATERGFSMALSRLGDPNDGNCVLVECFDGDGRRRALLSFVPWGNHGLSLDLMRRDRSAENGVMEFMVTSLAQEARVLGVERISLNFAVFRSTFEEGERIGAGPVLRLWRALLMIGSKWWQLESLYRSNAKYQPVWTPRFLCFPSGRGLMRVALATGIAEGHVPVPRMPHLNRRGTPVFGHSLADAAASSPGLLEIEGDHPEDTDPVGAQLAAVIAAMPEQVRVRRDKYERLRARGVDPYPVGHARTTTLAEVRERFGDLAPDASSGEVVSVTGRVVLIRVHGGICFATLRDADTGLQVMVSSDISGDDVLKRFKHDLDLGDHIGVTGEVVTSKKGELSVLATEWAITAKCLRPLPDKRGGLADAEARVRQRYVDLIVNSEARRMLRVRSEAVRAVRGYLSGRGYLEVETPMLQPVHGGANARPFTTHINAYDMRLYLRIAPELYLKRLMVGGTDRVFELNRNFRNEGADATHNPEFTMLEAYEAYGDYNSMQLLMQEMIQDAARAALGTTVIPFDGVEYDIGGQWRSITVNDAVSEASGEHITVDTRVEELRRIADAADINYDPAWGRGALLLELYEHFCEHKTLGPTFYRDFPTDVSPLTRQHRVDARLAERWDLVCFGAEIGTAYSELIDPVEQRRRLTEQSVLAAGGDVEAMELDEDFLRALEYAMPPSGGLGMGVDRMLMMLTGKNIRDTVLFPLVRPQ